MPFTRIDGPPGGDDGSEGRRDAGCTPRPRTPRRNRAPPILSEQVSPGRPTMKRRVRKLGLVLAATVAAVASAPEAGASPAMPRPLERKIADADAVVIARLRTQPEHAGDVYEVEVEESVKGTASGTIRVTAALFFRGCCPPPGGWPPADALEKD